MTGPDRGDVRRALDKLREQAGENRDLLDARPDDWREVWYSEDAEKWPRTEDGETPLWCVEDPETGAVYDVDVRELHLAAIRGQDPDEVLGE